MCCISPANMVCLPLKSQNFSVLINYASSRSMQWRQLRSALYGYRSKSINKINCQFMNTDAPNETPAKMAKDITPSFKYDECFSEQIIAKKKDHSYRVFKKMARLADKSYPCALAGDEKRSVTVWCTNDYLGLSQHPVVQEAAMDAIKKYGTGAGGSRNIAGNSPLTEELEAEIAKLHKKPAALVFSSGYAANHETLITLGKVLPGCIIYSDAGNHASMIYGIKHSKAGKQVFRYNDPKHVRELLSNSPEGVPKVVAFETVHSMTGAISPLEEMCSIAHEHGALTYVDEVHAVGLYGKHGAGIGEERNLEDQMDIVTGTLGKTIGNVGGYIAGSNALVDTIRTLAPGFIFTTALPPSVSAACLAALRLITGEEGRILRQRHQAVVRYMKNSLLEAGLPRLPSDSHIVPVPVEGADNVANVANSLMNKGHYVQAINYPTVPKGGELLRFAPGPHHTQEMVNSLILALKDAFHENGIALNQIEDIDIRKVHM